MGRNRTATSMRAKLTAMKKGDELFTDKPNGYVCSNISRVYTDYPERYYIQRSYHVCTTPTYTSTADFKLVRCITRLK